ncbi:hypothetical protein GALMADRAFT_73711 [Galerina marginata CBS 339.88]|uniref:NmrA-like domain-containing protein n=1 Tax=Galerina marginata (strain CBS 339.88) TaxID=685588 RepID=A0A067SRA2_GALM3|nr:hypothetical protein GALMADRAFT_73711 [Galerina marginata CBS 339.88]
MSILITGGTGQTGGRLAQLLHANNHSVLVASRSGVAPEPFKAVKFDWSDEKTFGNPFKVDSNIDKIYLIAPPIFDSLPVVKPFIDFAISKGVKRFVHGSSSSMDKGDIVDGKIHEYLVDSGVDYTIIRPTWFIENLGTFFATSIRDSDEIITVAKNGRVAFVGVDDIAQAAYHALVAKESLNTEFFVVGPDLYSYDEVAAILTNQLGRKITHRRISHKESRRLWEGFGLTPEYAAMLTTMEAKISKGYEEAIAKTNKTIIGQKRLTDYIAANKALWIKS